MTQKPDLIIFDFDGTLADSVGFFRELLPELSRKFRFRLPSHEEQEAMRGHPPREVMQSLGIPRWKLPMIAVYARKRARASEAFPLYASTCELLDALIAKGIPVAVVSSNGRVRRRSRMH